MSTNDELDLFAEEASSEPSATKSSPTVSDKYAGKTVDDLINMHRNAEKLIGKQSGELGALRRVQDRLLETRPVDDRKQEQVRQPLTVETLLNDPEKTLKNAIDSSDVVKRTQAIEARAERLEARLGEREFTSRFPTYKEDMEDPKFLDFIKSNKVRAALGDEGARGNFDAAANLWEMWTERQELEGAVTKTEKTREKKVPSTIRGVSGDARSSTGRKYSAIKIAELRDKAESGDPAAKQRWNSKEFQMELGQAHIDGRIV